MRTNPVIPIIAALSAAATAIAQENADAIKQRILAQAQSVSADDYAFTRTVRTEGTMGGKNDQTVNVEKYDPTKPADSRWSLVSVNGAAPSAEALNRFRKEAQKRRVPGYHRLANYLGSPATASDDARGRTVLRFVRLPKDSVTVMDSDVSQNATAEVTVNDSGGAPLAEQVRITLKPTRIKLVMKLNSFESTARYRMGPEGKPLLVEQTSDMTGSGMGQEGRMRTVTTYSDYRAVRAQR
jgi:hypothetical protein